MSVFEKYSQYYDLLYQDKDYLAEARFVLDTIARHASRAAGILEFGCGTGAHASLFASSGLTVHGVDLSGDMLTRARTRCNALPPETARRLTFSAGDIRTYRTDRRFDVVAALFHVMSYQTSNEDLLAALHTAKEHLSEDGIFIFDYWYGPAVLMQRPSVRVKRMDSDQLSVTRIAEPRMNAEKSCVEVNYTVFVCDKKSNVIEQMAETHVMRYLTGAEVHLLAQSAGLRVLESCEWMTRRTPDFDTWGVCTVLGR